MANDIDQSVRSDLSTKQSQIKVTAGREPSIPELTENKPVMRFVPGKGLMMYVRYNNKRYHVKFSDDPKQEGRIRVEDVGQPEIRSNQVFSTGQGGTGQDLTGETGAISISSGTVAAGTLPIAVGGTNATDSNTWLNTRVVMKANGVLGYDASAVACTMNTLADGGNIRSRVTAGLDSTGDVQRVVEPEYGGTGQDFSGDTTGYLRIVNGTTTQRSYANAKSDLSLNNVANVDQTDASNITSGTLSNTVQDNITRVGTVASGTWGATAVAVDKGGTGQDLSSSTGLVKVSSGTASAATLVNADISGSAAIDAAKITAGVLPTAQHSAHVTDNLNANGLVAGRTIGDAVGGVVIYSDPVKSGYGDDDTRATAASGLWVQSGTTATAKISINYYHESANESMKLACHLCTADATRAASVLLGVYPVTTGASLTTGSTPNMSSASAGPVTVSTTKITFDGTIVTGALDITGLTNSVLYKVVVLLNNADASTNTLMTSPTIIVYGS